MHRSTRQVERRKVKNSARTETIHRIRSERIAPRYDGSPARGGTLRGRLEDRESVLAQLIPHLLIKSKQRITCPLLIGHPYHRSITRNRVHPAAPQPWLSLRMSAYPTFGMLPGVTANTCPRSSAREHPLIRCTVRTKSLRSVESPLNSTPNRSRVCDHMTSPDRARSTSCDRLLLKCCPGPVQNISCVGPRHARELVSMGLSVTSMTNSARC